MSRLIHQHKWMMIREGKYETPFMDMTPADGSMVVALTESGDVLFLSEYSVAYDRAIWFLPGGAIDPGESPVESANRELQEEAGFKAARLDFLGHVYPFMKYMRGSMQIFLARDLTPGKLEGDEGWEITVQPAPFADFETLIASGYIQDSTVVAALYLARSFLEKERASSQTHSAQSSTSST